MIILDTLKLNDESEFLELGSEEYQDLETFSTAKAENKIDDLYYNAVEIDEFVVRDGGFIERASYLKVCETIDILKQVKKFWERN